MARVFPEDSPVLDPNNVPESLDKIERYLRYIQERVEHMNYAQGKIDERQQEELALVVSRAGTSVEINDEAIQTAAGYDGLNTRITQNANSISSLATRTTTAEGNITRMQSSITQNANKIALVVQESSGQNVIKAASIVTAINNAGSSVKIAADHITLSGDVVLKSNLTDNTTQISGGNIKTGIISSTNGKYSLNMNTGAVNMASANITGGSINISSDAATYDTITLRYGGSYTALGSARLAVCNEGNGYTTQYEGGGLLTYKTTGSSASTIYLATSTYGGGLTLRNTDGSKDAAYLGSASDGGFFYLCDANGDWTTTLYPNPGNNAKLLGSTTSSSWTSVYVGGMMPRYRAFVLVACRGAVDGGRGAMASTYIPYELARLCTGTSYESWVQSAQNVVYAGRCYFNFSTNYAYIISSGNADCMIKLYGIT